ncbi:MAG: AAA family ATPase [Candidatus Symbiobacter sp.]|nr:AAA family ATPase [Candidatus Symbiobacter sp.]
MKIESLSIRNYKAFRDVQLKNLPAMCVFVGKNGVGKSTLFDVFNFLQDCLRDNVRHALNKRGGFNEVISRDQTGNIAFEIKFREKFDDGSKPLITYSLEIGLDGNRAVVKRELLKYRRTESGKPWHFLDFKNGQGIAIENESDYSKSTNLQEEGNRIEFKLESPDILALKGLGQFERFKAASTFRKMIESWHVSDFHIDQARKDTESKIAEHLSKNGDNLANYAQYLSENYPGKFKECLEILPKRVPGIVDVTSEAMPNGDMLLRFKDESFEKPFIVKTVSDGTIKFFAYLLLLADPKPHPLMAVEEPENQLYPELLPGLCEEFRDYARRGNQIFISTHSPDFLNFVEIDELFALTKKIGVTTIKKVAENNLISDLIKEGDQLGYLWREGMIDWEQD